MENLASKKKIRESAQKLYQKVVDAYLGKKDQSRDVDEYWNIYNCSLGQRQTYNGDSQVFVPIVHDGVEARVKRRTSMLFPPVGQMIECISETGDEPFETIGLLEHYIRKSGLRFLVPGLMRRGDIEGQYSLMVDWEKEVRHITVLTSEQDQENPIEKINDVQKEKIVEEGPQLEVIPVQDLAVLPPTVNHIDDADLVCVILRYSKDTMEEFVEKGRFLKAEFEKMAKSEEKGPNQKRAEDAGIKTKGSTTFYQIYKIWTHLDLGEGKVPAVIYLGGQDIVLSVAKNPFWSQKIPIISSPVEVHPGSFFGISKIKPVAELQYQLNDITNMAMDSARYSVLPIVMTDPVKNPNVGSMVLAAAAIWETSPQDTQFAAFPPLWKDAMAQSALIKQQIMESMDVNDIMLGKMPAGRKNAQQVAAQQNEALATITDSVRLFQFRILDEILEWFFELDQQYRPADLVIENMGPMGVQAKLQKIPPQQLSQRYFFKWVGLDQVMGIQRVQQMLGFMNVLRGMPPNVMNGYKLDVTPIIEYAAGVILGAHIAPRVIADQRHQLSLDPHIENEMLYNNIQLEPSVQDNHEQHIIVHQELARQTGDPHKTAVMHIMKHIAMMQVQALQAHGTPGSPPGGGFPGVAGTPRMGATPGAQRIMQGPPGQIHQDQMADGNSAPGMTQ